MSPKAFIEARQQAEESTNNDKNIRFHIDGQPYLPLVLASTDDETSMKDIVGQIFELTTEQTTNLRVKPVVGGNTNQLFCIAGIAAGLTSNNKVLLRIFGGEGIIDRDVETSTYAALAQQGLALKYYGRFGNGRLEEWSNDKVLQDADMAKPAVCQEIAKQLAKLHSEFVIPDHLQEYHDVIATPTLWKQLNEWLDAALNIPKFQTPLDTERATALEVPKLQDELKWLKNDVINGSTKVGFCHNDVLASNILCNHDNGAIQLQFLDFEYGGMNYYSYDIANHFNEFAGGTDASATPDYTQFPNAELQRLFCTAYLQATKSGNDDVPTPEQVDHLLQEVQGFGLANHLVWGLWGINQAAAEGCTEFDYLKYAGCRLKQYYLEKKQWLTSTRTAPSK